MKSFPTPPPLWGRWQGALPAEISVKIPVGVADGAARLAAQGELAPAAARRGSLRGGSREAP